MKDAIVIKVKETDEDLALGIQTDVRLTERSKYLILLQIMRSLDMSIDWMDRDQIDTFSLKMLAVSLSSVSEEKHED